MPDVMPITMPLFQPAHPRRGATPVPDNVTENIAFQPAHPRRGATAVATFDAALPVEFQPAHPRWGATQARFVVVPPLRVSTRAPP